MYVSSPARENDWGLVMKITVEALQRKETTDESEVKRQRASRVHFCLLHPGQRKLLVMAASIAPMKIGRALVDGHWSTLVSELNALAIHTGDNRYAALATTLGHRISPILDH